MRYLLVLLVAVLGAELVLRAGAAISSRPRGLDYHPVFGWKPVPNIEKLGRQWSADVPASTNSRGWRDDEVELDSRDRFRIVAVGDSFTFGVAVDQGDRFSELLERTDPRVEVVNLGVNAYGTDQELLVLEHEGLLYGPDVVLLLAFLTNDLEDIQYERRFSWPKPYFVLEDEQLRLVPPSKTWDVWVRSSSYLGELGMRPIDALLERSVKAEALRGVDAVQLFTALVERAQRASRQAGAEFLVVVVRGGQALTDPPASHRRALDSLLAAGIPCLDLAGPFLAAGPEADLFAPDGHWSRAGHLVVSEALLSELTTRGWLPQ